MRRNQNLSIIINISILMALAIVFKVTSYTVISMRISLFAIPLLLAGLIGGPALGALAGLGADLIYGTFISTFAFNPFFTISAVLWGFMGGFLRSRDSKINMIWLIIVILITSVLETSINTLGMFVYAYKGVLAGIPKRLVIMLVKWPIIVSIVKAIDERIILPFKNTNFKLTN